MERRQTLRVKVQFRSLFSAPNIVEGDGMVVDLSHGGVSHCDVGSGSHWNQFSSPTHVARRPFSDNR